MLAILLINPVNIHYSSTVFVEVTLSLQFRRHLYKIIRTYKHEGVATFSLLFMLVKFPQMK